MNALITGQQLPSQTQFLFKVFDSLNPTIIDWSLCDNLILDTEGKKKSYLWEKQTSHVLIK